MFEKSSRSNIDGFVVRRRSGKQSQRIGGGTDAVPEQFLHAPRLERPADKKQATSSPSASVAAQPAAPNRKAGNVDKSDLSAVLARIPDVDLTDEQPEKRRRFRITKKGLRRAAIVVSLMLLLVAGFVVVKFIINGGRVFDGNMFSALLSDGKELKKDEYGRTNILMFGTSEDSAAHSEGENHLADSIMVASIDSTAKTGFMFSIPRDLWVKYSEACNAGYEGKINEAYGCGLNKNDNEAEGAQKLESVVEEHFGIDIQYNVHVNYTALKEAVDAVGGITVQIESDDPRGIYDPNFDWQCNYQCNLVKWPNGPAELNGEHALALARARNAAGGYGLAGGNFDREQNQQKILIALKDKASSAGVLANPVRVTGLLDTLGNNVRTNIDAGEIKTFIKLAQEINTNQLKRISLIDEDDPLVTTGSVSGISVVKPVAGMYDFSEIKGVIKAHLSGDTALLENATITVLNGSGVPGAAQAKADELMAQGYAVTEVGNAPAGEYAGVKLYDLSEGEAPSTKAKLQQQLAVGSAGAADALPEGIVTDADFVIIVGTNGPH